MNSIERYLLVATPKGIGMGFMPLEKQVRILAAAINRTTNQRRWTTRILVGQEITMYRELGKLFFKLRYKRIPLYQLQKGNNTKDSNDSLPKTQDYAKIIQVYSLTPAQRPLANGSRNSNGSMVAKFLGT